jgi:mono/diheme cytochrome c family protein
VLRCGRAEEARVKLAFVVAAVLLLAACSEAPPAGSDAARRGRQIYENVCIACHHADPTRAGALGPALAGASRELIEAKVLRGEYPPGYTPQLPSRAMPKFEYLRDRIDDLAAYLSSLPAPTS